MASYSEPVQTITVVMFALALFVLFRPSTLPSSSRFCSPMSPTSISVCLTCRTMRSSPRVSI